MTKDKVEGEMRVQSVCDAEMQSVTSTLVVEPFDQSFLGRGSFFHPWCLVRPELRALWVNV
jgi:hypothetical protein